MKKLLTYIFLNIWLNLSFAQELDLDYEWQQALNLAQTIQDQKSSDESDDEQKDEGKILDYVGLMRILKGLHDEIIDITTLQKNEILDKVHEIQIENEELIHEMTNQFTERTTEIYNNGMTIIATLGKYMMENQMKLFTFAEILIQKIKDEKAQQIQNAQQKINQLLMKFPPPKSACDFMNDCETCINHANCIWCSQDQMCHEGNQLDGAFFFPCPYQIYGTCDTPKSLQFFDLEVIPYRTGRLENFLMDQNMPFEQKQYIMKKQNEMIMFKNEINSVRLKLNSIQNLTIILRAKRIILQFYMNELEKNPNLDIQNDDDYIEFFLDIVDIDDVGDVVSQLEDEVEQQKMEDKILDEQAMEEQLELEQERLEARRAVYENSGSNQQINNNFKSNKPQQQHSMGNSGHGGGSDVKAGQQVQQQQQQQSSSTKDNTDAEIVDIDGVPQDATLDELMSHQKNKDKQKQKNYLYYYQN